MRGIERVRIVAGTHRYEAGAIELAKPLVDVLNGRGTPAMFVGVPKYAADRHLYDPSGHVECAGLRARWWRELSQAHEGPVFSLHNYPHNHPETLVPYKSRRKIGAITNDEGEFGVYIYERRGFMAHMKKPHAFMQMLSRLRAEGITIWQDWSLLYSSIIEIPAVRDDKSRRGVTMDIRRTDDAGFLSDDVLGIMAREIERITGSLPK